MVSYQWINMSAKHWINWLYLLQWSKTTLKNTSIMKPHWIWWGFSTSGDLGDIPSLPLLPGPKEPVRLLGVRISSIDKRDLFEKYVYQVGIFDIIWPRKNQHKKLRDINYLTTRHKITQTGWHDVKINQPINQGTKNKNAKYIQRCDNF